MTSCWIIAALAPLTGKPLEAEDLPPSSYGNKANDFVQLYGAQIYIGAAASYI